MQPSRKTGWSTTFVWENGVRTELVTLGPGVAISYGLDGKELWRMNRMGGYAIQSPFAWNDLLFITSGAGGDDNRPIVAVRAGASGDITVPEAETRNEHVVWFDGRAGGPYLPTPVIYKNALYVLNNNEAAEQYRLLHVNALDDFSMATPAIVGDRLLIRTQHRLYSIRNPK